MLSFIECSLWGERSNSRVTLIILARHALDNSMIISIISLSFQGGQAHERENVCRCSLRLALSQCAWGLVKRL